jgi:hypothetical protein
MSLVRDASCPLPVTKVSLDSINRFVINRKHTPDNFRAGEAPMFEDQPSTARDLYALRRDRPGAAASRARHCATVNRRWLCLPAPGLGCWFAVSGLGTPWGAYPWALPRVVVGRSFRLGLQGWWRSPDSASRFLELVAPRQQKSEIKKRTNEAVILLKIKKVVFWKDSKAVRSLKSGGLSGRSRQVIENKPLSIMPGFRIGVRYGSSVLQECGPDVRGAFVAAQATEGPEMGGQHTGQAPTSN